MFLRIITLLLCLWSSFAKGAVQDFAKWNPDQGALRLNQGWTFYWQELLTPGEIPSKEGLALEKEFCWQKLKNPQTGSFFPSYGYGTFVLRMQGLKSSTEGLEFFMRSAATAYETYIYPETRPEEAVKLTDGIVGVSEILSVPQALPRSLAFNPKSSSEVWVVLIRVSNFHHVRGGLWQLPYLSKAGQMTRNNEIEHDGLILSIGMVIIIGIYNLMIFLRSRKDYSTLALAFFCLIVTMRAIATSDLLTYFFPEPNLALFNLKYRIEYATVLLGPFAYSLFMHHNFPKASWAKAPAIWTLVISGLVLFILIVGPGTFTRGVLVYQAVAMGFVIQILFLLFRALRRKEDGALLALSGSVILAISLVYDILIQYGIFSPPFVTQYGTAAFVFLQSQVISKRFAKAFQQAQTMQETLQIEVDRQTVEIRSLMDHVPLGIFMVTQDLRIQKGYSKHLEDILEEQSVEGRKVLETLFRDSSLSAERKSIVESTLNASLGESSLVWDMNSDNLPLEFDRRDSEHRAQTIEVNWHPVVGQDDSIDRILVTTRNVTQLRQLQNQAEQNEMAISLLTEMVQADPKALGRFWPEAESCLSQIRDCLGKTVVQEAVLFRVARDLHTMKGVARALGLRHLTGSIHETETIWPRANWSLNEEQLAVVHTLLDLVQSYLAIYQKRLAGKDPRDERLSIAKGAIDDLEFAFRENPAQLDHVVRGLLCAHVYASLFDLSQELQTAATGLAKSLDKVNTLVMAEAPPLWLTPALHVRLRGALQHLIGNAIDHGIETFSERRASGKSQDAHIFLHWSIEGDWLRLDAHDDGKGIHVGRILARVRDLGWIDESSPFSVHDIPGYLFRDGFSTAKTLTDVSGRGIGLTAAQVIFEEMGGSMQLVIPPDADTKGERIAFRLLGRLPLKLFVQAS